MKKIVSAFVFLVVGIVSAQSIRTNPASIAFDSSWTTTTDSAALWIVNETPMPADIVDINVYGTVFSVRDTSFRLNAGDSVRTWIYFSSVHNLTFHDFVLVETDLRSGTVVVPVTGTKKYVEPLYAATQGKSGEALKSALTEVVKVGHATLGYTTARDRMYGNIDNINGTVECIYTGRTAVFNTRAGATANNFNCEHTWPQSKFAEADPMVSDIHHLFSTDEAANSKRSNFPFGVVVTPSWSVGGSKYGSGYGGQTVFEPRDEHKGDCARAMFYFITRYPNNYGSFWGESPYQEAAFREWSKKFPPTAKSKNRNNAVHQYQGNRNPYIDHPELLDRISTFGGNAVLVASPKLIASPMSVRHANVAAGSTENFSLILANTGTAPVTLTSAVFSDSRYSFTDSLTDIEVNAFHKIGIQFQPSSPSTDSLSTVTFTYSNGIASISVVVNIIAASVVTSVQEIPHSSPGIFLLAQNFPNPFNPVTAIEYSVSRPMEISLKVFDVLGREVAILAEGIRGEGIHRVNFDASHLPSGVYFCRLMAGNSFETRRMMLQK